MWELGMEKTCECKICNFALGFQPPILTNAWNAEYWTCEIFMKEKGCPN